VRKSGKQGWLVANSIQNDKIKLSKADFRIPIVPTSIAGYVASTAETVLIDDPYAIPKDCRLTLTNPLIWQRAIGLARCWLSR